MVESAGVVHWPGLLGQAPSLSPIPLPCPWPVFPTFCLPRSPGQPTVDTPQVFHHTPVQKQSLHNNLEFAASPEPKSMET